MYIYIYICIYICVYVYIYVYKCICTLYIYTRIRIQPANLCDIGLLVAHQLPFQDGRMAGPAFCRRFFSPVRCVPKWKRGQLGVKSKLGEEHEHLVGGFSPTPLKNDGLRQLGWMDKIPWFQTTSMNTVNDIFFVYYLWNRHSGETEHPRLQNISIPNSLMDCE